MGWEIRKGLPLDMCQFYLKNLITASFAAGTHLLSSRSKLMGQNWKLQVG